MVRLWLGPCGENELQNTKYKSVELLIRGKHWGGHYAICILLKRCFITNLLTGKTIASTYSVINKINFFEKLRRLNIPLCRCYPKPFISSKGEKLFTQKI